MPCTIPSTTSAAYYTTEKGGIAYFDGDKFVWYTVPTTLEAEPGQLVPEDWGIVSLDDGWDGWRDANEEDGPEDEDE